MRRRSVCLLLLIINGFILLQHSSAFFNKYGLERDSTKCCPWDEAVYVSSTENGTLFGCKGSKEFPWRKDFFISNSSGSSFFETCTQTEECVDYQVNDDRLENLIKYSCHKSKTSQLKIPKENILPKCCDLRHSYDTYFGACRADDDNGILGSPKMFYVHIGLSDCNSVISDHVLENLEDVAIKDDLSIVWEAESFPWGSYCFDRKYNSDYYVLKLCEKDFSKCRVSPFTDGYQCIRKCCPLGQNFLLSRKCGTYMDLDVQGYNFYNKSRVQLTDNFAFIHGLTCRKYLGREENYNYTLDEDGNLRLYLSTGEERLPATLENYCYERAVVNDVTHSYQDYVFLCDDKRPLSNVKMRIISTILCISVICLLVTFMGYLLLPDMQNLHGRTLMMHCFCLMVAFSILAFAQIQEDIHPKALCKALGYLILFWFLAAFTWLNIMCFDIWWTFGSMRVQGIGQRQRELKRFLCYNVYGWSFPLFFTVFAVCAQNYSFLPKKWTPDVGRFGCFFSIRGNFEAYVIFFLMPVTVLIICNGVLFARTTYYCYKVKSEIAKIKDSSHSKKEKKKIFNADRERLTVIFKLFVIMGISWIFEGISGFLPYRKSLGVTILEIIIDSYNAAEGILIFCVFMLKNKILRNVQKRFGIEKKRKISSQATTNTSVHSSSLQNCNLKNMAS